MPLDSMNHIFIFTLSSDRIEFYFGLKKLKNIWVYYACTLDFYLFYES